MSCGGESVFRMDIPSSNDERVEVDIGSASIILLPSPTGVGGVTSTGTFFRFIELRGDRILSSERSRLVGFVDPNCKSFAGSLLLPLATVRSSRLFLLSRRGLLLLLALGGGCGEIGRAAVVVEVLTGSSS